MSNNLKIQVKAGRYLFDQETKKVKVSRQKGLLTVLRNAEEQTHLSWANLQTNIEQMDLIVFPNDAIFEEVIDKKNTFVLRFQTDSDRYFFWFQEKVEVQNVVKKINSLINYQQPQPMQAEEVKPQPMQIEKPSTITNKPKPNDDFISIMTKKLMEANKHKGKSITHLGEIIGTEAINSILKQVDESERKSLIQYLPENQQQETFIESNLRSPQFLQALQALSDALNTENAIALFMQLGLDQKFLHKHYGVEAFLRALQEWGRKNPKKQQKQ